MIDNLMKQRYNEITFTNLIQKQLEFSTIERTTEVMRLLAQIFNVDPIVINQATMRVIIEDPRVDLTKKELIKTYILFSKDKVTDKIKKLKISPNLYYDIAKDVKMIPYKPKFEPMQSHSIDVMIEGIRKLLGGDLL